MRARRRRLSRRVFVRVCVCGGYYSVSRGGAPHGAGVLAVDSSYAAPCPDPSGAHRNNAVQEFQEGVVEPLEEGGSGGITREADLRAAAKPNATKSEHGATKHES